MTLPSGGQFDKLSDNGDHYSQLREELGREMTRDEWYRYQYIQFLFFEYSRRNREIRQAIAFWKSLAKGDKK
jgi:hypothetical protein